MAPLLAAAVLLAFVVAGCGDDGGGGESPASDRAATVREADGILVDADGAPLYTSEQEARGKVRCTDACARVWLPLTLPAGSGEPTGADDLGVTTRPGGGRQVTYDGKPLYRFAEDSGGEPTGDGVADDFGGVRFTWRVASTDGGSEEPADGGGYGY